LVNGLKKKIMGLVLTISVLASLITAYGLLLRLSSGPEDHASMILGNVATTALMQPRMSSDTSIEEALLNRRSVRSYVDGALTLEELSQLLWAAQGLTGPQGLRTAPSAGGLYPLEVYVVVGGVESLSPGVYRYLPSTHSILRVLDGDRRAELARASLDQSWVKDAAVDIIIAAIYERTTVKYGERGVRYVHLEAGHAAQNLCLQATALRLGVVTVGAFDDEEVSVVASLPQNEKPLYVIPVGRLEP
jgi:SagB-type dehydrogenase family enzyme